MNRTGQLAVGRVMTTDLLTVGPHERLDLAALIMDRRRIRQLIVCDDDDRLVGLVSYRALIRLVAAYRADELGKGVAVRDYMEPDPVSVSPDTAVTDAIWLMLDRGVSAVPVVDEGRVVGILSEHDVIRVAAGLLEHALNETAAR